MGLVSALLSLHWKKRASRVLFFEGLGGGGEGDFVRGHGREVWVWAWVGMLGGVRGVLQAWLGYFLLARRCQLLPLSPSSHQPPSSHPPSLAL